MIFSAGTGAEEAEEAEEAEAGEEVVVGAGEACCRP
jgi:hypothetical protein